MIQRPGTAFDRCKPDNVVSLSFENYTVDGIEKLIVENKDFVSVILFIHYSKFLKRWAWEEKLFSKSFSSHNLLPHTQTQMQQKIDLNQIERFARERYIPVMLDDTKELLFNVVREVQPKRILEIGTAVGYSGIVMLLASPEAHLNTMEISEELANIARQNFAKAGVENRVNIFLGDARELVAQLTGNYDFIFMDGPKGQYEAFLPYLTELLDTGGTLVCDNVLYKGLVEHVPDDKRHKHITVARNMHAFLDDITANPRYDTVLHRIGDGVTVSVKKY